MSRRRLLASALQPTPVRPNVLFIIADTWRGQALPFAGDPNLGAPNLTRLAREGVHFSRAYTSYAVCCPARAAIITGKHPWTVGVRRNHTLLPLDQPTMSQSLRDAGYRTGYIGKWHLDGRENPGFVPPGRRRGFDYWAAYNVAHQHFGTPYFRDSPEPLHAKGFEADFQTDLAIEFLRQKSAQPFFLFLSWVPPHAPFTPPSSHDRYRAGDLRLRPNVSPDADAQARRELAGYYGLCSAVDSNLGRLLSALDQLGTARDTIAVFTSDHGVMFGSHGLEGFDVPYEESVRIPLLIRYPRRIRPNRIEGTPVSNADLAPTLLRLCGLEPLRGMEGADLSEALIRNRRPAAKPVFAEGAVGGQGHWRMVVHGGAKLVVDQKGQPAHLFDLEKDPYEMDNRVGLESERGRRDRLLSLLA